MVANVLTPELRQEKQVDLLEFEGSTVYISTTQSCHVARQGFYVSYRAKTLTVAPHTGELQELPETPAVDRCV